MEPVAFGLKFAGAFSGGTFIGADLSSRLQATGVDATCYAVKLAGGHLSVIILNKDTQADLPLTLDFGSGKRGKVQSEALHAPALDSREAHISAGASGALKDGKYSVVVPHASGLRVMLS